jgi:hypothetical protein
MFPSPSEPLTSVSPSAALPDIGEIPAIEEGISHGHFAQTEECPQSPQKAAQSTLVQVAWRQEVQAAMRRCGSTSKSSASSFTAVKAYWG